MLVLACISGGYAQQDTEADPRPYAEVSLGEIIDMQDAQLKVRPLCVATRGFRSHARVNAQVAGVSTELQFVRHVVRHHGVEVAASYILDGVRSARSTGISMSTVLNAGTVRVLPLSTCVPLPPRMVSHGVMCMQVGPPETGPLPDLRWRRGSWLNPLPGEAGGWLPVVCCIRKRTEHWCFVCVCVSSSNRCASTSLWGLAPGGTS